ncbi:hypothetical protein [Bdellovibrio bacteriovorus]|uniref:hypothetical protein n=1 Tax=Bdellovibrio bacteriovorus TaxID=959 RepID=UPI0035A5A1A5
MSLVFSVPGKTFIAGEYLALAEGPTLFFLSQPCFETEIRRGKGDVLGIHQDSPAGVFISKHRGYFRNFDITFRDAYSGKGGFGASTAQFLSVYAMWLYKEAHQMDMEKYLDFKHMLEVYYHVAWNGQGQRPSGADLVAQLKGSMTFFEKRRGMISVASWPFDDLELLLVHTGNKLATHEHLRTLPVFPTAGLESAMLTIRDAFDKIDSGRFVEGVKAYAQELLKLNFTCEPTLKLLSDINQIPGVKAAKGCGALGVDVMAIVTAKGETAGVKAYCESKGLSVLSSSDKISLGLQVRGSL